MSEKITKKNMDYFQRKYPIDQIFANPSTAPASILHVWLLLKELLEVQRRIEGHI